MVFKVVSDIVLIFASDNSNNKLLKNKQMKNLELITKRLLIVLLAFGITFTGCKKDEEEEEQEQQEQTTNDKALVIETGARSVNPGENLTYSAVIVDVDGNVEEATAVTWSTSDNQVCSINASGAITSVSTGNITVTASVDINGTTLTASVPLGIYAPTLFAVAPSAIIYEKGGDLQLETVYLSADATVPTYTFESSDNGIASVNSSGLVTFNAAGDCYITVTANLDGSPSYIVPVLVIEPPVVELPVVRVEVDPPSKDLFRNETQQLTAKAYNFDGDEVTGKTVLWGSVDENIATVNASGMVSPVNPGTTYIQAVVDGIVGQAEIIVNPDTLIVVEPYYFSIPAGSTKQLTAKAYHVTRTNATLLDGVDFTWGVPTYGFSMFDIAEVDQNGLVTVKTDAMAGMMTFVYAYDSNNPNNGSAAMMSVAIADDCDCGAGNAEVDHIVVNNGSSVDISLMDGTLQLDVTAYDLNNNIVSSPALVYCSDNIQVASVDSNGEVMPAGEGTATI
jgi:hypothetical protein